MTTNVLGRVAGKSLSLPVAWAIALLVSPLPDIFFREIVGDLPAWLYAAKIGLIVVLLLASISWPRLRVLWLFLL